MKRSLSVLLLLILGFGASCSGGGDDSGEDDAAFTMDACGSIGLKIINGDACTPGGTGNGSPIVRISIEDGFGDNSLCSGTAISSTAVLTAAHCFINGVSSIQVDTVLGSVDASSVVVHPNFSSNGVDLFNDVAVVFTAEALNVSTFPILTSRQAVVGEEGVVAGFGETENDDFGFIQAGNAFVSGVSENHVFLEFDGSGSNPCQGDSGGPILLEQGSSGLAIAGVVSTGNPNVQNCGPGDVTLFAATANDTINDFILSVVPTAGVR